MPVVNRLVLVILRSPAHRLLSGSVCELSYTTDGGRVVHLPVQYAQHHGSLVVMVGHAASKRWWRAFRRPRTVTVRQAGRVWTGIGRTIHPDHPASRAAGEAYARARHVTPATNDRIVLIDPVAIKERPCTSSPGLRSPSPS